MCLVRIGGEKHDFVAIEILGREDHGTDDFWDSNWLTSRVEVSAGGFRGCVQLNLRADEFAVFLEHVQDLSTTLAGTAELRTLEGGLTLRLWIHGRGDMWVDGDVFDGTLEGNRLRFHFNLDQSYLPAVISQLQSLITCYPVIGAYPSPE
jgi:hypothetical protein